MKSYKNYIFDFYGTLVDIETDENKLELWDQLTQIYNSFGCYYGPRQLKTTYLRFVEEAEEELRKIAEHDFIEIDLEQIFVRLLTDAPQKVQTENVPKDIATFGQLVATVFRVLSRQIFETFKHTIDSLHRLKENGAKLFILSNAQRIFTQVEIESSGCFELMDQVYLSSDYRVKKPDPAFLKLVMEENNLDVNETVIIGNDLTTDIAIAQEFGMKAVLLNTFPYSQADIQDFRDMGWDFDVIDDILELVSE
ncbi:TPA: HAD family hydrolase [Streptococcus suis]|nr:HAD family hydrolase [Streptococcus suis]